MDRLPEQAELIAAEERKQLRAPAQEEPAQEARPFLTTISLPFLLDDCLDPRAGNGEEGMRGHSRP